MSVAWSRRKPEEPEEPRHPDPPVIIAGIGIDPANPNAVAVAYRALEPVPYAGPDGEQDDDVIEPTSVFNPWVPGEYWDNVEITVKYYD